MKAFYEKGHTLYDIKDGSVILITGVLGYSPPFKDILYEATYVNNEAMSKVTIRAPESLLREYYRIIWFHR